MALVRPFPPLLLSRLVPYCPVMSYTKLFNSIVTSTIWTEDDKTRIVWITMLALADKNGEVQGSIPGLARIAGVAVDDCRSSIDKFLSPDPDSRTRDDEGRRIEEIDGGWHLLNHRKYREMASKDESRESEAKRKARYRAKLARNVPDVSQTVRDMSQEVPENSHIAEAEAEAETEAVKPKRVAAALSRFSKPSADEIAAYGRTLFPQFTKACEFWDFYESKGWKIGNSPMKDWKATVRNWHRKDTSPKPAKSYSHANAYDESTSLDHL